MTATPLGPGPEFDRIRAIGSALGAAGDDLGDDCAFLPDGWCASTDLAVEDVHFRRAWLDLEEIGWRAAGAALSDLAAVAARAEAVLVALGARAETTAPEIAAVMRGIGAAAQSVGARVVGGDLSRGPGLAITITVLGRAAAPVRRRGARPGDGVWVSGTLGGARAALTAWEAGRVPTAGARQRFARPAPRIELGRALGAAGATAMLDLSDGLAADAGHLASASEVGLELDLDRVPVDPAVAAEAVVVGRSPAWFAAAGGEDYELLVTLPAAFEAQHPDGATMAGVPLTRIGRVVAGAGVRLMEAGVAAAIPGFDHFR